MTAPRKPLKVALVYPPVEQKISEPIPTPNITIAVLADALVKNGYETKQIDAEKLWFDSIQHEFAGRRRELLYDVDGVFAYVNGRAAKKLKAEYDGLCAALLERLDVGRPDAVGVTLVDMRAEPLIIHFSALLAHAVKTRLGAKTVIGYKGMSKEAFFYLMKRYPSFDYGVYAEWGEMALLRILEEIGGAEVQLVGTVARRGARLKNYAGVPARRPYAPTPRYETEIIDRYRSTDADIFAKYDSDYPFVRGMIKKDKEHLIVSYGFEVTCPGACAFCDNNNKIPSDIKSVDQVIDELSALKARGVTGIYFVNSSFNNHYKTAEALCEKMIKHKLGLTWFDCANLRVMDEPLLDKMRAAGAIKLAYGVESGSRRLLDYLNKGITPARARKYLEYSNRIGIWNHIELIAGFPTETDGDVADTLEFIESIKEYVDIYTLNPFYLYRNSRFFREPDRFGLRVIPYPPLQFVNFFYPRYRIVKQYSMKFDEIGGLPWAKKNRQIVESTKAVAGKIDSFATYRAIGNEHVYLLSCLYDKLGHDKKDLIRKMLKILTRKFKPYNLNFFLDDFRRSFHKEEDLRIFHLLRNTPFLGKP